MDSFSFSAVAAELDRSKEEGLTFADKQLTWDTAEDVKDIVTALETTKVVHFLQLEGNTLGIDAAAAIGKALEKHKEFRKALWRNMFTRRLKSEIPVALQHLGDGLIAAKAQLTVLDLSDNALGPNGMVGLEDLLRSPVCFTLEELHLNNCGLGIGGGQMLSKAILDCHRTSKAAGTPLKLKKFIAGRNRLENDGAKAIAKIFSTLKTFEEIVMPQNSIYHEGIAALAEGIKCNKNLRVLNLNDNIVTHKGSIPLAEAFAFTKNLREINFGDCLLKTNGAYLFAEALENDHKELEVVDLGYNEIGVDGGMVLITALQNKFHLQRLNLDGNQFGSAGCESIRKASRQLPNPNALDSLDEDQSDADDDDADEDDEDEDDDDDYVNDVDDEDDIYDNNDTTEEAVEDEEYADEESAYVTTQAYNTKIFSGNESFGSTMGTSTTFAVAKTNNVTTMETFCLSQQPCSLQMFETLKEPKTLESFKQIINQFTGDKYLLLLIFTTLKCAHLAKVSQSALNLAIALFQDVCDYAVKTNQEKRVLNYILIQLGLLRSEKKFKNDYNKQSCRFALQQTLCKDKISSSYMKNAFEVFLKQLEQP